MKIKIVSDLKQIKIRLDKIKNIHSTTFLTGKIAHDMKKEVALRFRRQQDPEGNPWKPLKGDTILNRYGVLRFTDKKGNEKTKVTNRATGKRIGGTPKILQNTGRLRNSISISNNKEKAIIGTNLIYAATHQFGAKNRVITAKNKLLTFYTPNGFRRKRQVVVNIPARPFMGLSNAQKEKYREWIRKWKRGELS